MNGIAPRPAVAVLPFVNLGGDEATGRLADGITEDLIDDLTYPSGGGRLARAWLIRKIAARTGL